MAGMTGGSGFFFRIMIAGITSMLIMSTMTVAVRLVAGVPADTSVTGGVLGNFISPTAGSFYAVYNLTVIIIGVITFIGSFYVLSKK